MQDFLDLICLIAMIMGQFKITQQYKQYKAEQDKFSKTLYLELSCTDIKIS